MRLTRHSVKLLFDEGIQGEEFLGQMFTYATNDLLVMHKRKIGGKPVDPLADV